MVKTLFKSDGLGLGRQARRTRQRWRPMPKTICTPHAEAETTRGEGSAAVASPERCRCVLACRGRCKRDAREMQGRCGWRCKEIKEDSMRCRGRCRGR